MDMKRADSFLAICDPQLDGNVNHEKLVRECPVYTIIYNISMFYVNIDMNIICVYIYIHIYTIYIYILYTYINTYKYRVYIYTYYMHRNAQNSSLFGVFP